MHRIAFSFTNNYNIIITQNIASLDYTIDVNANITDVTFTSTLTWLT